MEPLWWAGSEVRLMSDPLPFLLWLFSMVFLSICYSSLKDSRSSNQPLFFLKAHVHVYMINDMRQKNYVKGTLKKEDSESIWHIISSTYLNLFKPVFILVNTTAYMSKMHSSINYGITSLNSKMLTSTCQKKDWFCSYLSFLSSCLIPRFSQLWLHSHPEP